MTTSAVNTVFDFNFNLPVPVQDDSHLVKQLSFVPGLKEILMLRQVHALEHATVWVLSESERGGTKPQKHQFDNNSLSGVSTEQGFYLYGEVSQAKLQRAVVAALERLKSGESDLAVHPRCGTNLSVGILLSAGLVVGFHLLLPRGPIEQFIGLGLAATTAATLAPTAGLLAQRYVTTAIPANLAIENIKFTQDLWGQPAYFVQVRWSEY